MASDSQKAIEKLNRIALHYTGGENWDDLFNTQEWKQVYENNLSTANGDEEKAQAWTIQALGLEKLRNQAVNCRLLESRKFTPPGKDEMRITTVLLPNGRTLNVWDEYLEGDYLSPVVVKGLRIDNNIGEGKTNIYSRKGDSVSVVPSDHNDPIPEVGIENGLRAARKTSRKNKKLRENKANGFFTGTPVIDEDNGVFVNDHESSFPGVKYVVEDPNGERNRVRLTIDKFEEIFGFDPTDDRELTRQAIEGQFGYYYAEISPLASLPDEIAERFEAEILDIWRKHSTPTKGDNIALTQRIRIGAPEDKPDEEGYWVERIYQTKDANVVAQVDVSEVPSFLPEATVGPEEKENKEGKKWVAQEGTDVWFPDVTPGERPVSKEAAEMAELLKQRKLNVEG